MHEIASFEGPARHLRRPAERMHMTMLHTHPGARFGSRGLRRNSGFSAAGVTRKISAALRTIHHAIVEAKLRRLRNELMLHRHTSDDLGADQRIDISRIPQRPVVLGDKWDY